MEGAKVYVQDAGKAWQKGTVEAALGQSKYRVRLEAWEGEATGPAETLEVDASKLDGGALPFQNTGMPENGFPNMTTLDHLHEAALLHNLRVRFFAGNCPYTYTADIVIAVNPYRWFPDLYTDEQRKQYLVYDCSKLPPHVYATSSAAYAGLTETKKDQAILVSGESGAGKTETVKILMAHLALIASSDDSSHIRRIVESNPLLESFGNAQTVRNDNSSRFGKFIELQLNGACRLVGSKCRTYLLEKSRVVGQDAGERNYHIFYQMLAAEEAERSTFSLGGANRTRDTMRYTRLGASKTEKIEGQTDAQRFKGTQDALSLVGVEGDVLLQMLQALAGILLLGQVDFTAAGKDSDDAAAQVTPESLAEVENAARAMKVDEKGLAKAITQRTIKMQNESISKPLPPSGAVATRDATAKELYARVFDWLVGRICEATSAPGDQSKHFVGLLDIFGFESFAINRFEQFCINYANEKLQQKFTLDVFKAVQQEYSDEGIPWDRIEFQDNAPLLSLVESKLGIVAMLNEECVRPKGSDQNFVSKLSTVHKADPGFSTPKLGAQREVQFAIKHYAGSVLYTASGWLERNKDTISQDVVSLMQASENPLISGLFAEPPQETASDTGGKAKIGADTVATKFKTSLAQLMETISRTTTQYVRCIKPNKSKSPSEVDNPMVVEQLRCAGVIEAIRISRAGFPARMPLNDFISRFSLLVRAAAGAGFSHSSLARDQATAALASKAVAALKAREDKTALCRAMAAALLPGQDKSCEVGRTRVYFKAGVLEGLEESRSFLMQAAATQLARIIRGSQQRQSFRRMRGAALRIQQTARMACQRRAYWKVRSAIVTCQACRRAVLAKREAFGLRQQRCACRLQAFQRGRMARANFGKVRRAAVRLQAAFRCWSGRRRYLANLAELKEQAKLENQVKALQAKLEAKEREARERQAVPGPGGQAEPPAEILETLNTLTAENAKLRTENERQRAEIEKLRDENRHLRADRAAKDELLHSLRRAPKETASTAPSAGPAEPRASSKTLSSPPRKSIAKEAGDSEATANQTAALQLCPPLSHFWEDVPSEMIPLLKDGTEVHLKLGANVILVDERDDKRLTWKSWLARAQGYRRTMAFYIERRNPAGESEAKHGELSDDNSIGAAFALRSALTGRYITLSSNILHAHALRVAGNRPEEAAVFTCIPLLEGPGDAVVGTAVEYLCSIRLLGEKRFLRLRTDGHVAMVSVSDPEADVRHDKMAVTVEKLLPRASYEIVVEEDPIGIALSKDLPLRVCGLTVMAEPSCAEGSGRVHVADVLTSVNGQDIVDVPANDVVRMISCKKPVTLGFTVARDPAAVVGQLPAQRDKEPAQREKRGMFSRFQTKSKVSHKQPESAPQKPASDAIEL